MRLHFSNFLFKFEFCSWIFRTVKSGLQPQQDVSFFTRTKSDVIWTGGLSVVHGNHSMAVFILSYRIHPYRWAAIVLWSNYLIQAVEPWDSYAKGLVRHRVETSEGLFARLDVHHAASHDFWKHTFPLYSPLLSILSSYLVKVHN